MSHPSGADSLMLDIKYDFRLLWPPALVIVMQARQNTPSHALHLLCRGDSFMISNQRGVFLLDCAVLFLCLFSGLSRVEHLLVFAQAKGLLVQVSGELLCLMCFSESFHELISAICT